MALRLWLALSVMAGCGSERTAELAAARSRIAALEHEVARLRDRSAATNPAATAEKPNGRGLQLDTPFAATCPGGWHELGAIGNATWSCLSPPRAAQCHIIALRYDTKLKPNDYFDLAQSLVPDLRPTKKTIVGPIVVDTHPGFVATYERQLAYGAQKALASILVEGDAAYVTSCWTSRDRYADLELTFRNVIESLRFTKPK